MKNIVLLAFLYFATGVISLELLDGDNIVNLGIFAPEGIALAFALLFGKKVLPGIFIGQFLLAYSNGVNLFSVFEISFINTIEAWIGIVLFTRFKLNTKLECLRDIIGLILIIVFALQVFSAVFGSLSLLIHGEIGIEKFYTTLFSWGFGNVIAQLLFTPFLLILFTYYKKIDWLDYSSYAGAICLYSCSLELFIGIENPFLLLILNIPVLLYVLANKGILYGTLMSVIVAIVTSYTIYANIGVFQSNSTFENIVNYNLFVLLHTLIVLIVGVLFQERTAYEENLQKKIESEVAKNREQQLILMQQSRLAQMGEMINMIAHQWRQPLNNLSLVNQLLVVKYNKGSLDENAMNYFEENSLKQINLMSTTIDDFRDFFRTEKIKELFDIKDVIDHILEMTQPIYTSHHIVIDLDIDREESFIIMGYQNALAQAIINIINNAKDALIELNEDQNRKIIISLKKEDTNIILTLKDNAGGIPIDIIENIFDPYFSTKEEKNGTGLGLYMTKTIIEEQIYGKITASNDEDGAVFTIVLKGEEDANK